jgi:hypothetical protein
MVLSASAALGQVEVDSSQQVREAS